MLTRLRTVLAVAMLTVATYATAVETRGSHPETYVVVRGDTLWDIAGRFLGKPWLWPEIWQANPQVANPHLIYPGDVLSLAYLDRVAVQPGPREEAPIGAIPLADIEPFLKNLRVADSFEHLPYVVGFEDNRLRGSAGQAAYIKGLAGAQAGQRYAVLRPTVQFGHPRPTRDLQANGRPLALDGALWREYLPPNDRSAFLGYELAQVNVGTITGVPSRDVEVATLQLEDSGREVRAGDRLVPVEPQPYDLQFFPHAPAALPADVRVLAVARATWSRCRPAASTASTTAPWSRCGARAATSTTASPGAPPRARTTASAAPAWSCRTSTRHTPWCSAPSTRSATRWSWTG